MTIYLDSQIVVWLCEGKREKLTAAASEAIEESELVISPMVLLELEYLYEIKRSLKPPLVLFDQLAALIGLKVSEHAFPSIIRAALFESWTRDLFDRVIVAQARSDGYSGLVTSDAKIREHYSKAIW